MDALQDLKIRDNRVYYKRHWFWLDVDSYAVGVDRTILCICILTMVALGAVTVWISKTTRAKDTVLYLMIFFRVCSLKQRNLFRIPSQCLPELRQALRSVLVLHELNICCLAEHDAGSRAFHDF
jgi:hypothetical protein